MTHNWFQCLLNRKLTTQRQARSARAHRSLSRLTLEQLEDRLAPATHFWIGGGANNNWSNGNNWIGGIAPTATEATPIDLVFPTNAAAATTAKATAASNNDITFTVPIDSILFTNHLSEVQVGSNMSNVNDDANYNITGNAITVVSQPAPATTPTGNNTGIIQDLQGAK